MDHKRSNPDTNSWVDDRLASLDPAPDWKPDASRALDWLTQRQPAGNAPWMRLSMTATILAATVLVLVMLPWGRLWMPKAVTTVAAQTGLAPAEKPTERAQENPAPKQPVEAAQHPPAAATTHPGGVLSDLPNNEQDLQQYLERLAQERGVSTQPSALVSQADVTSPHPVHQVVPEYTDEARQARIKGIVEMIITVKADGTVQFGSFTKTLGYGLDERARGAIEQWLFTPAKKDGTPIAKTVSISMNFDLK